MLFNFYKTLKTDYKTMESIFYQVYFAITNHSTLNAVYDFQVPHEFLWSGKQNCPFNDAKRWATSVYIDLLHAWNVLWCVSAGNDHTVLW